MKHRCRPFFLILLVSTLFAGCRTAPDSYEPLDTTKYTVESTDKFVPLDRAAQILVTCTGLQERILPDGRLEVVANVKNRERRKITVQLNCVFKDENGFSTGDETPFRTLTLAANVTEAVKFTSANNRARKYSVRVQTAP